MDFKCFANRKDHNLFCFKSEAHNQLVKDICTNSTTGYVVDMGFYVNVPKTHAEAIKQHLLANGWSAND